MKGKINCYLCQRAIAEHRRGELCWLNALATGAEATGAPNIVTAVLLDFRGWDTMGERASSRRRNSMAAR